jgi:hypothetical protein
MSCPSFVCPLHAVATRSTWHRLIICSPLPTLTVPGPEPTRSRQSVDGSAKTDVYGQLSRLTQEQEPCIARNSFLLSLHDGLQSPPKWVGRSRCVLVPALFGSDISMRRHRMQCGTAGRKDRPGMRRLQMVMMDIVTAHGQPETSL